jgi:hypothetical protein
MSLKVAVFELDSGSSFCFWNESHLDLTGSGEVRDELKVPI